MPFFARGVKYKRQASIRNGHKSPAMTMLRCDADEKGDEKEVAMMVLEVCLFFFVG